MGSGQDWFLRVKSSEHRVAILLAGAVAITNSLAKPYYSFCDKDIVELINNYGKHSSILLLIWWTMAALETILSGLNLRKSMVLFCIAFSGLYPYIPSLFE